MFNDLIQELRNVLGELRDISSESLAQQKITNHRLSQLIEAVKRT